MKHKYILLIIVHLFFLKVSGQKKIIDSLKTLALNEKNDSLKATLLNKIGKEYWYINTDTSELYTLEATEIARRKMKHFILLMDMLFMNKNLKLLK